MTSPKQMAANRANSKLSTGPRSHAGKARSSANALTHGLTAERITIAGEDPREFEKFLASIVEELEPCGLVERELVEHIAILLWRLKRVPVMEAAIIRERGPLMTDDDKRDKKYDAFRASMHERSKRFLLTKKEFNRARGVEEDAAAKAPEKAPEVTEKTAEAPKKEEPDPSKALGAALISDSQTGDALGKTLRYEATLNNTLGRTMSALLTLQEARREREQAAKTITGISEAA